MVLLHSALVPKRALERLAGLRLKEGDAGRLSNGVLALELGVDAVAAYSRGPPHRRSRPQVLGFRLQALL